LPQSQQSIGIALPVREWSPYADEAIKSFSTHARSIDRLFVSIDGSEDELNKFQNSIDLDNRVSFLRTTKPLSMAGHYEWCVAHLCTEWVTVLGQDDALQFNFGSEASRAIEFARSHDLKAISFRRAYFNWNDGTSEYLGYGLKYATNGRPRQIRSKPQLVRGLLGFVEHFDLPQIYTNNLVRKEVVDRIRQLQDGRVFLEPIPDTYSGVAVAADLSRYLRWPVPVFWTGTSNMSAGLAVTWTRRVPAHIVLANAEGRSFGVSQEYWVQANNSSVFILSALLSRNSAEQPQSRRALFIQVASASVFAARWTQMLRKRRLHGEGPRGLRNAQSNTRLRGLKLVTAAILGLLLIPLQAIAHSLRTAHFLIGTLRKNGLRVLESDAIETPSAANAALREKQQSNVQS